MANVSRINEKASDAAVSVADYQKDITELKSDIKLIKFGIGLIIVAEVMPILKTLFAN